MLNNNLKFNRQLIRNYTIYEYIVDEKTTEKEISFAVKVGPLVERKGDVFPVYEILEGKTVLLSDWSLNVSLCDPISQTFHITNQCASGGSLGRITRDGHYAYILNCAVFAGQMKVYSPSRPIRYLSGEWIAICFHHIGLPFELFCRATFRFIEVPIFKGEIKTKFGDFINYDLKGNLDKWLMEEYNKK